VPTLTLKVPGRAGLVGPALDFSDSLAVLGNK
jgi:hypothetical protein